MACVPTIPSTDAAPHGLLDCLLATVLRSYGTRVMAYSSGVRVRVGARANVYLGCGVGSWMSIHCQARTEKGAGVVGTKGIEYSFHNREIEWAVLIEMGFPVLRAGIWNDIYAGVSFSRFTIEYGLY